MQRSRLCNLSLLHAHLYIILGISSKVIKGEAIPITGHGARRMEDSHKKEGKIGEKKLEIMEGEGNRYVG
ncbi:hypothetical protein B7P43_G05200 [Cryptotermes secundus]|uniref:Uncharacterized protein n=1 Tax=Cryptotermes secundus TaxID=105785 RepID=A0A2J7QA79_9NEOP|nr:hypothetical protein B7P43_G05200 [Cryptotermes secundus]